MTVDREHYRVYVRDAHHEWAHGEKHYRAKLTEDDVRLIRELSKTLTNREIAGKFDVSHHCIHQVNTYKTWSPVR